MNTEDMETVGIEPTEDSRRPFIVHGLDGGTTICGAPRDTFVGTWAEFQTVDVCVACTELAKARAGVRWGEDCRVVVSPIGMSWLKRVLR